MTTYNVPNAAYYSGVPAHYAVYPPRQPTNGAFSTQAPATQYSARYPPKCQPVPGPNGVRGPSATTHQYQLPIRQPMQAPFVYPNGQGLPPVAKPGQAPRNRSARVDPEHSRPEHGQIPASSRQRTPNLEPTRPVSKSLSELQQDLGKAEELLEAIKIRVLGESGAKSFAKACSAVQNHADQIGRDRSLIETTTERGEEAFKQTGRLFQAMMEWKYEDYADENRRFTKAKNALDSYIRRLEEHSDWNPACDDLKKVQKAIRAVHKGKQREQPPAKQARSTSVGGQQREPLRDRTRSRTRRQSSSNPYGGPTRVQTF